MNRTWEVATAPVLLFAITVVMFGASHIAARRQAVWRATGDSAGYAPAGDVDPSVGRVAVSLVLLALVALLANGVVAFAALAVLGAVQAGNTRRRSRTAAIYLAAAAFLSAVAAVALWRGGATTAFGASVLALAVRTGTAPLHAGVGALTTQARTMQLEQLATLPLTVFAHLHFVSDFPIAHTLAPSLVWIGAASTLGFALISLVQRDLRALYDASTLMHGGMLFAAIGAAGRGHNAAALLVAITMALALTGFAFLLGSFEARVGPPSPTAPGGRARAFPRLAAGLAFFGAAAVGLPGTAGFVADDLLLHALWEESVISAVSVIVASALLAVATLAIFTRVFFGKPTPSLAPDLEPVERRVAVVFLILLVTLGFAPRILVSPVNTLLQ